MVFVVQVKIIGQRGRVQQSVVGAGDVNTVAASAHRRQKSANGRGRRFILVFFGVVVIQTQFTIQAQISNDFVLRRNSCQNLRSKSAEARQNGLGNGIKVRKTRVVGVVGRVEFALLVVGRVERQTFDSPRIDPVQKIVAFHAVVARETQRKIAGDGEFLTGFVVEVEGR